MQGAFSGVESKLQTDLMQLLKQADVVCLQEAGDPFGGRTPGSVTPRNWLNGDPTARLRLPWKYFGLNFGSSSRPAPKTYVV
jgi:hypothetical protein